MIEVKKVLIIVLLCTLGVFIATSVKLGLVNTSNSKLQKDINNSTKENDKLKNDNLKYEEDINNLKEVNKEKWEELNTWISTKEAIQKALS